VTTIKRLKKLASKSSPKIRKNLENLSLFDPIIPFLAKVISKSPLKFFSGFGGKI
jgi:hypothetical protein